MSNAPWGPQPPPGANHPVGPSFSPPPHRTGIASLVVVLSVGLALLLVCSVGVVRLLGQPANGAVGGGSGSTSAAPGSGSASSTTSAQPSQSATAAPPSQQPTTSTSPTSKPSPKPSTPKLPAAPNESLKKNTLYSINLSGSGSCKAKVRRAKPPLKNSALAPYLRTVVTCLVNAFKAPLAAKGFTLTTPKVKTFKGSVKTPCGTLGSSSNPAFYCAGTIYWPVSSDDGREAYTFARLGYVGLLAHEFGHHLQSTTGMLYEYGDLYQDTNSKGRLALSRRLELQAQCFEGVFLSHDSKAIKLSSRDRSEIRTWHSYTGDEDPPSSRKPDHGTSAHQYSWLEKGLAGADFGRCNTWSASSKAVK